LEVEMPKFVTIGYGDEEGYDRTPKALRDAAHRHDELLVSKGAVMGIAGGPVQVRNAENAGVSIFDGPYLASDLPVAGFAIIEAASMEAAIELVSMSPCAVAHGVVEVWPLKEADGS
jgi:hypothetical protein